MPKQVEITYSTPSQPRQLRLDTTTFCNAGCRSCHRFLSTREGKMSQARFFDILDDVARWSEPLTEIVPVNYGEFFTLPDWERILKTISQRLPKTQIIIPTNGSLLDDDKIDKLCKIAVVKLLNFSVNAFFDETYKTFMELPAKTLDRIASLIRRLKVQRSDITAWVSMVHDPSYQTDLERDKFIEFWRDKADHVWILNAASCGRPDKKIVIPNKLPCRSIFSDIVIGFDGKLSSCCFDASFSAFDLGYYSGDLKRDWNSDKFKQFR